MVKLLGLLLFVGALAAVVAFVPVGGRTILDRWHASQGPSDFARRGWHEVAAHTGLEPEQPHRPAAARARSAPGRAAAPSKAPVERHTPADRAALERIVSEHAEQ
jgi:hypothetical protein